MPAIGLTTASVGALVVVFLGVCVAALMSMWDRAHVPPHKVMRWVWCPRYERTARVDFIERVQTGFTVRKVEHCPLRRPGEHCGEGCVWERTVYPAP
jgi:hypothetical protein